MKERDWDVEIGDGVRIEEMKKVKGIGSSRGQDHSLFCFLSLSACCLVSVFCIF